MKERPETAGQPNTFELFYSYRMKRDMERDMKREKKRNQRRNQMPERSETAGQPNTLDCAQHIERWMDENGYDREGKIMEHTKGSPRSVDDLLEVLRIVMAR